MDCERDNYLETLALQVVDECLFMTLAMVGRDGKPYCVPVHAARAGAWLYFHCAPEGEKIDCLHANPAVCLSAVGDVKIVQNRFTTEYVSAVVRGHAQELVDAEERIAALRIICRRFTPEAMDGFDGAIAAWLSKTAVWRVQMEHVTGKRLPKD